MDCLILFGRQLLPNGQLDWIAQARCNKAIQVIKQYPHIPIIISGGKTTLDVSEAEVMKIYILNKVSGSELNIVLEETGKTTINQLVIIKTEFLIPNGYVDVGLISDEIHMSRIQQLSAHIFGSTVRLHPFSAKVKISGLYRKAIEEHEARLRELTTNNPIYINFEPGNHQAWQEFDSFFQKQKDGTTARVPDANKAFLEYAYGIGLLRRE